MRLPPVPTWVLAAATLAIYACDAQSSSVRSNVPVDAGHAPPPRADASFHGADAGAWAGDSAAAPILGQRVANVPARIFAVAPDESEILFIAGDGTLSTVSPSGANPSQITSAATFLFLPNPITWMFLDPSPDGLSATVGAYHPGTSTVTAVVRDAAFRVLFPNPTTSRAIATTGFVVETGSSRTSTHTAGLIAVDADGGRRTTLLPRVNVGVWDDVRTRFSGRCSINAVWTSSTSAFVSVCVRDEEIRQLLSIDTLTGRTTTVALDVYVVNKAVRVGADRTVKDVRNVLDLRGADSCGWLPEVLKVSGLSGDGVLEVAAAIDRHRGHLAQHGLRDARHRARARLDVEMALLASLRRELLDRIGGEPALDAAAGRIVERTSDVAAQCAQLLHRDSD